MRKSKELEAFEDMLRYEYYLEHERFTYEDREFFQNGIKTIRSYLVSIGWLRVC